MCIRKKRVYVREERRETRRRERPLFRTYSPSRHKPLYKTSLSDHAGTSSRQNKLAPTTHLGSMRAVLYYEEKPRGHSFSSPEGRWSGVAVRCLEFSPRKGRLPTKRLLPPERIGSGVAVRCLEFSPRVGTRILARSRQPHLTMAQRSEENRGGPPSAYTCATRRRQPKAPKRDLRKRGRTAFSASLDVLRRHTLTNTRALYEPSFFPPWTHARVSSRLSEDSTRPIRGISTKMKRK